MQNKRFTASKLKPKHVFEKNEGYYSKPPVFAFRFFHENRNKNVYYTKNDRDKHDLYNFLIGMQKLSNFTWGNILKSHIFHGHDINGFQFSDLQIVDEQPMQFTAPGLDISRIIGFMDKDNIFQIVKFDKKHQVYPEK